MLFIIYGDGMVVVVEAVGYVGNRPNLFPAVENSVEKPVGMQPLGFCCCMSIGFSIELSMADLAGYQHIPWPFCVVMNQFSPTLRKSLVLRNRPRFSLFVLKKAR